VDSVDVVADLCHRLFVLLGSFGDELRHSAPGVLAEAAHKTGRAKADFELREISKEQYEWFKSLLL
jgi:hypothetical protein